MAKNKKYKFVVEFCVSKNWIADGFNLTNEQAEDMLRNALSYAYEHEISAKVIKRPPLKEMANAQGFKSIAAMRRAENIYAK